MHTAARRPSDFRKCLKGAVEAEAEKAQAVEDIEETVELLLLLLLREARAKIGARRSEVETEELLLQLVGARTKAQILRAKAAI